jgi:hypothetical protein
MAEEPAKATNNDTATEVSDAGAQFGGGGGMMSWQWIGDMVDNGVNTQHQAAAFRQGARGHDPCIYFASIDELWATDVGPAWWKATSVANRVSYKLRRAIRESIRARGRHAQAASQTPLQDYLMNQIDPINLLPDAVVARLIVQGFAMPFGMSMATAPGQVLDTIRAYLPRGSDILDGSVSGSEKGLEIGPGVFLWAPGLPSRPQGEADNRRLRDHGRYIGPLIKQQVEAWVDQARERVVPAGFSSARMRLTNLTGSWEGSGDFGVWIDGDGYSRQSKIGYLEDWYNRFWAERAEAQQLCRELGALEQDRLDEMAGLPGRVAKGAFVLGMAGISAWLWGK